jgi:PAS domain S-box-containing protein
METREELFELLERDPDGFSRGVERTFGSVVSRTGFDGNGVPDWEGLCARERELVRKVRALSDAPCGLTLSGAAFEDNPLVYANRTFRRLTGYSMRELHGRNPRLLQGPDTERAAVGVLHEALRTWAPVTVELWNYRRDGTRFRNRVSLRPILDGAGTVTNWYGVQGRVEP